MGRHGERGLAVDRARRTGEEPDHDAGGNTQHAGHHGHRRCEVHAVPGPHVEEGRDDLHPGAVVAPVDGRVLRVGEVVGAEELLQGDRPLVVAGGGGRHPVRGLSDRGGKVLRQLEVGLESGGERGARREQLGGRRLHDETVDGVVLAARGVVRARHREALRLPEPVVRDPLDSRRRVGQGQPSAREVTDIDPRGLPHGGHVGREPGSGCEGVDRVGGVELGLGRCPFRAGEVVEAHEAQVVPVAGGRRVVEDIPL